MAPAAQVPPPDDLAASGPGGAFLAGPLVGPAFAGSEVVWGERTPPDEWPNGSSNG